MKKKKYLAPDIKMTEFEKEEILTNSATDPGTDTDIDPTD